MIKIWLRSANVQILLKGEAGKQVVYKRGLPQGNPLSPLLFTLIADGLNNMIRKAKRAGLIEGLAGPL